MLELKKRPCQIGCSANMRREKHGDDSVPAVDIPISMLIERRELDQLLPFASAALFTERPADKFAEPAFEDFDAIKLKAKYEQSSVTIWVGVQNLAIALSGVTLAKLKIAPLPGGMTALDFKVQSEYRDSISRIFHHLDGEAHIVVQIGNRVLKVDAQKEMELEVQDDDDDDESVQDVFDEADRNAAGLSETEIDLNKVLDKRKRKAKSKDDHAAH